MQYVPNYARIGIHPIGFPNMIKTKRIYTCDKCGKQKTIQDPTVPEGWIVEWNGGQKHYCSKKCKPRRKIKYVNPNEDSDPGVGALYGRT